MDLLELKKEQVKLAPKVVLRDGFTSVKTIGGMACQQAGNKLIGCVVVCEYPSLKFIEKKTYVLANPLPYHPGYTAYREMPALMEAYNQLEEEPDVILVQGEGVLHPRRIGIAAHIGLALNKPTIGVQDALLLGKVEKGKIIAFNEIMGFEIKTREHSNPVYVSPGHLVSLGAVLQIITGAICYPHKMPEPIHIAHKIAKKKGGEEKEVAKEKVKYIAPDRKQMGVPAMNHSIEKCP